MLSKGRHLKSVLPSSLQYSAERQPNSTKNRLTETSMPSKRSRNKSKTFITKKVRFPYKKTAANNLVQLAKMNKDLPLIPTSEVEGIQRNLVTENDAPGRAKALTDFE